MDSDTGHLDDLVVQDDISERAILELWSISELSTLAVLPKSRMISSKTLGIRQQLYQLEHPQLAAFTIRRTQGTVGSVSLRDFFLLDIEDSNHQAFKLAVHPELIWSATGLFLAPDLAYWSIGRAPEICEIVDYALIDVFEFFDWTPRGISKLNLSSLSSLDDAIYFTDQNATSLVAFGNSHSLNLAELTVRTFSAGYRRNCLWLGRAILFDMHLYLLLQKTTWSINDVKAIEPGDLLCLQQVSNGDTCVDIRAQVTSRSTCSVQWSREVYFRMTDDDSKISMGRDNWSRTPVEEGDSSYCRVDGYTPARDEFGSTSNDESLAHDSQQVVEGMSGPEDVVLEVIAGVTQVNFNDLCNIQEGSLVELQTHTLPMVRLAVRGIPILEGELVRFKDTVMVQVTQRISDGSRGH